MNNNRIRLFFLIIIICIGIFLRIFQLGKLCFWCDEFLAIFCGWQPLKDMINYITYKDAHPPLFYALVHFLLKYGNSEFYLRLLPSFFGIITIPLAYFVGKEFKDEKTGIIFSIFISLNPALILWSRILKSYSLFTFFLLLSLFFFLKILKTDKKQYYIFLFFSDIILLYLHNFAFIWILIEVFTLLFNKIFNKKFLFYYIFIFIFYLPWFLKIPYQLKFTLGVIRPIPFVLRYPYLFFYFFFGETLHPFNLKIVIPFLIVIIFIVVNSFIDLKKLEKVKKYLLFLGILIPLFLVPFPSTVPQNLLPFSIFVFLLLSIGYKNTNFTKLLFFCFFILSSFSTYFYFTGNTKNFHDVSKLIPNREINEIFSEKLDENSIIFLNGTDQDSMYKKFSPFHWYYKGNTKVIEVAKRPGSIAEIKKICKSYNKIGLFLNYNEDQEWNNELKNFFFENFFPVYQAKFLHNEKLLSRLKGKKEYYWFVEIYIFEKHKK